MSSHWPHAGGLKQNHAVRLKVSFVSSGEFNLKRTRIPVQCCFTSTETVGAIGDGEPRTSTSTFTQLLSSEIQFNVALRPQRPWGLLRTGSPGRPLRLSHSFWALPAWIVLDVRLLPSATCRNYAGFCSWKGCKEIEFLSLALDQHVRFSFFAATGFSKFNVASRPLRP